MAPTKIMFVPLVIALAGCATTGASDWYAAQVRQQDHYVDCYSESLESLPLGYKPGTPHIKRKVAAAQKYLAEHADCNAIEKAAKARYYAGVERLLEEQNQCDQSKDPHMCMVLQRKIDGLKQQVNLQSSETQDDIDGIREQEQEDNQRLESEEEMREFQDQMDRQKQQ